MEKAVKKPIHDDRVDQILKGLTEGKSRDELAKVFKYKNYKSLDIYMRRKNWRWNSESKNYEPDELESRCDDTLNNMNVIGTTVGKVIELFNSGIKDPEEVSKKAGFKNPSEMAEHMKKKHYVWDDKIGNYVMLTGRIESNSTEAAEVAEQTKPDDFSAFIPLLNMLQDKKDMIIENLTPDLQSQSIPTYLVPGIATVLSAQMMSNLKSLLRSFSKEKNITQRQILEVALIEFFKKYGYDYRVKEMLRA